MGRPRLELQALLKEIVDNVYFQPPPNVRLVYPCIVYARDNADVSYADNSPYRRTKSYTVTVIDRNPDSDIPEKVSELPLSSFNRFFTSNDLNHDVYTLYF